jgi:hypothetical protein
MAVTLHPFALFGWWPCWPGSPEGAKAVACVCTPRRMVGLRVLSMSWLTWKIL